MVPSALRLPHPPGRLEGGRGLPSSQPSPSYCGFLPCSPEAAQPRPGAWTARRPGGGLSSGLWSPAALSLPAIVESRGAGEALGVSGLPEAAHCPLPWALGQSRQGPRLWGPHLEPRGCSRVTETLVSCVMRKTSEQLPLQRQGPKGLLWVRRP